MNTFILENTSGGGSEERDEAVTVTIVRSPQHSIPSKDWMITSNVTQNGDNI